MTRFKSLDTDGSVFVPGSAVDGVEDVENFQLFGC
jgi:hypothetical protein